MLILGENELARGEIKLRRMADGEESDLPLHVLAAALKELIA